MRKNLKTFAIASALAVGLLGAQTLVAHQGSDTMSELTPTMGQGANGMMARMGSTMDMMGQNVARGAKKAGQDITKALKKSAHALDETAKWSGTKLKDASQKTTETLKHMGRDAKIGAEKTGQWFMDVGQGIKDIGHRVK